MRTILWATLLLGVILPTQASAGRDCEQAKQTFYRVSKNPCGGNLGASCGQATVTPVLRSYRENMERICAQERAREQRDRQEQQARDRENRQRAERLKQLQEQRQTENERHRAFQHCMKVVAGGSASEVAACRARYLR